MTHVATLIMLLLVVIGAAFMVIAAIGILRMPDLYTRLHVASKAPALGLAALALALAFHLQDVGLWFRAAALGLLLFEFLFVAVTLVLALRASARFVELDVCSVTYKLDILCLLLTNHNWVLEVHVYDHDKFVL